MGDKNSVNHHWWPVGLQKYWADDAGFIHWIDPDGATKSKQVKNRKIAYKRNGHTFDKGSVWEVNFEKEFSIDSEVHEIISRLRGIKPFGQNIAEIFSLIKLKIKKDNDLRKRCRFYEFDDLYYRKLLLFICSLLIRSPSNRNRYESFPEAYGLPRSEEVGKLNMEQQYRLAKKACMAGCRPALFILMLYTPLKKFTFGDGCLDGLTNLLTSNRLTGKALVPLTPNICIYVCSPRPMTSYNCGAMIAAPWMVDWINEITQIYSKEKLFFNGAPPKLENSFKARQHFELKYHSDELTDMLDTVAAAGYRAYDRFSFPNFRVR